MNIQGNHRWCLGLLAAGILAFTVPASAEVEVRFFEDGSLLVGCSVSVLPDDPAYPPHKLLPSPDGTYLLTVNPGTKVTLYVSNPTGKYVPVAVLIPAELREVMDVNVVPQPPNDLCADAEGVDAGSVTPGTTNGATLDYLAPCGTPITAPGVWYTVVGTGNTMTASTCNDGNPATGSADYDSKINIACLGCDTGLSVASNDDGLGCDGFSSKVSWCTEAGAEYLILVQGFGGATGNFELAVSDDGTPCFDAVPCTPPPPFGACCSCLNSPFNCTEVTLDECEAIGGGFQGDGTTCQEIVPNESSPGLAIPDGLGEDVPGPVVSDTITVADSGIINDVNVAMTVEHTWISDLEIAIEHNGVNVILFHRNCGDGVNLNSTADDEHNYLYCAEMSTGPLWDVRWAPGAWPPAGWLSEFDGMNKQGDWTLSVFDYSHLDTGTLDYWALQFDDEVFPTICDVPEPQQVTICHYPAGNPDNARTITVSAPAADAHIAQHGDTLGSCEGRDLDAQQPEAVDHTGGDRDDVFRR